MTEGRRHWLTITCLECNISKTYTGSKDENHKEREKFEKEHTHAYSPPVWEEGESSSGRY